MRSNQDADRVEKRVCTYFFSWTPVVIGALVGLGLGFLLDLFGMGIGLSSYTTDVDGATALAVGGLIGLLIGAFATMFTAGFAAGFFAGPTCGSKCIGVVYGFVAWCLSLLLVGIFSAHVGNYAAAKSNVAVSSSTVSEVSATAKNVTTRVHPATDNTDTKAEKEVRATGLVSLSMFLIFFVGALSACLGGHCGLKCWHKADRDESV